MPTTLQAVRTRIAIVNYRTSDCVVDCLRSLEPELEAVPGLSVTVVDNASGDASLEHLSEAIEENGWSGWVELEAAPRNGGFAYGNNLVVQSLFESEDETELVMLLNPDTWIRPGAIRELVDFMQSHPDAGIAGCRLENPDGTLQSSCFRFYNLLSEFDAGLRLGIVSRALKNHVTTPPAPIATTQIKWASGAALMIRRKVFEDVGLMDDDFFLYYEEADFQRRAADAGWQVWYVHEARVVHLIGKSSSVTGEAERVTRRPKYWYESRRRYFTKHHGRAYSFLASLAWFVGFSVWRVRRRVQRKPNFDPPGLWRDFLRYGFF